MHAGQALCWPSGIPSLSPYFSITLVDGVALEPNYLLPLVEGAIDDVLINKPVKEGRRGLMSVERREDILHWGRGACLPGSHAAGD